MTSFTGLEKVTLILSSVTVFFMLRVIFRVVYEFAIGPLINKVDFKSKGKWALVTGATDGIGKEYARQLAAKGCDIVLVSRSLDKLKAVAEEIEKDYNVQTKVVQADFSQDNIYEDIATAIADLEIGTLVNNVGVAYDYPEYFLDVPDWDNQFKSSINVNVVAMTRMTAMVLPEMVKRGKGVVINITSGTAVVPCPFLSTYAATKAYGAKLSDCLRIEYAPKGVIVQCIYPGLVVSNMSRLTTDTFTNPTPKKFVNSALSLVGTSSDSAGFFPHYLQFLYTQFIKNLASGVMDWLAANTMLNLRTGMLKKYKKQ